MKKGNIIKILFVLGLVVLLYAPSTLAWSINPAKWTLYHKDDYEIEPYEWPMEITNDGDSPISVTLSVIEPKYLYDEYKRLPDLSWVIFSETEFVIPANSKATTMITIDITNSTEIYNQSYEFWIFADQTEGAGNIQTDYNCRWMIITPERFVPVNERAGYVPWHIIYMVFAIIGGLIVVLAVLMKKGVFKKKKPVAHSNTISMGEQKSIQKQPTTPTATHITKPPNNTIKIKRGK